MREAFRLSGAALQNMGGDEVSAGCPNKGRPAEFKAAVPKCQILEQLFLKREARQTPLLIFI
jgi:hypothetical protein